MYPKFGDYPVVPAADFLDMQSSINRVGRGSARIGDSPFTTGKQGGFIAIRDAGASAYSFVFAQGDNTSSAWKVVDNSATYTPLNLTSSYTVGADSTYAAGLLTTDGGNDDAGRVSQTITSLPAGKYRVSGSFAAEGSASDYVQPRLKVAGATDGDYYNKGLGKDFRHATAAESADPKGTFSFDITLTVAQNVVFTLDLIDEAAALVAGSAYITLNALEAVN